MECCLAQGELIRFDGGKSGVAIRCTKGTIWLTCGDGRDYLLSSGVDFKIAAGQIAVAESLQTAECIVIQAGSSQSLLPRPILRLAAC